MHSHKRVHLLLIVYEVVTHVEISSFQLDPSRTFMVHSMLIRLRHTEIKYDNSDLRRRLPAVHG